MFSVEKNDWLIRLSGPLAPLAVGADPRLSDEFYKVKQEIDKISGCDYALIEKNCETILSKQAKDLRVLAYLLFAKLQRQGVPDFCLGLALYTELLNNFGEQLLPQKPEVKSASIQWLNEPRVKQLLQTKLTTSEPMVIQGLITQLKLLNEQLQKHFPEMPQILSSTLAMLEAEQRAAVAVTPLPVSVPTSNINNTSAITSETVMATPQCKSDADFRELLQLQLDYLYSTNDWLQAIALARAVRWSSVSLPTQQNNITHVGAPHESLRSNLAYLVENGTANDILKCCENILLAPGGIYYLDAQYHAYRAANQLNMTALATYISGELRLLLERVPDLLNLHFADQTPFVSPQYRTWAESLLSSKNQSTNKTATVKESLDVGDIINQMRAKVAGKTLVEKITFINSLPKPEQRIRFQQDLALARFCMEEKRLDLALPLLEQLVGLVERYRLDEWEPEFALTAWSELRAAWKIRQLSLAKDMQKQVEQRVEELFSLICQTNLERAVNLR